MPSNEEMPRVSRVLDGLAWIAKAKDGNRVRLPCTLDVIRRVLFHKLQTEQAKGAQAFGAGDLYSMASYHLACAVYSLAFTAGLRPSEIAQRQTSKGTVSAPLRLKDIEIHQAPDGSVPSAVLYLPKRKNDQMGFKSDVAIGRVGDDLVEPIDALLRYIDARRAAGEDLSPESLLFPIRGADGQLHGLTYQELTDGMNTDLASAGFDPKLYHGHSWRIGMATTLAMNNVPEYIIKDAGGWSRTSTAFNIYIARATQTQRMAFTQFLARPYDASAVSNVRPNPGLITRHFF